MAKLTRNNSMKKRSLILGIILFLATANAHNIFPINQKLPLTDKLNVFKSIMINKFNIPQSTMDPIMKRIKQQLNSAQAKKAITSIKNPAEKKTWENYKKLFINKHVEDKGIEYIKTYKKTFNKALQKYHVSAKVITAISGVETRYGTNTGSYNALDALSSIAFNYGKREQFFQKELANFIILTQKNKLDPLSTKSSYAGALGIPQFMPSSYLAYAVNENGAKAGNIDLLRDNRDSIMSIANYLHIHKWKNRKFVVKNIHLNKSVIAQIKPDINNKKAYRKVSWYNNRGILITVNNPNLEFRIIKLNASNPENEYWAVTRDFDAIMSYNPRHNYAMVVYQLSKAI